MKFEQAKRNNSAIHSQTTRSMPLSLDQLGGKSAKLLAPTDQATGHHSEYANQLVVPDITIVKPFDRYPKHDLATKNPRNSLAHVLGTISKKYGEAMLVETLTQGAWCEISCLNFTFCPSFLHHQTEI